MWLSPCPEIGMANTQIILICSLCDHFLPLYKCFCSDLEYYSSFCLFFKHLFKWSNIHPFCVWQIISYIMLVSSIHIVCGTGVYSFLLWCSIPLSNCATKHLSPIVLINIWATSSVRLSWIVLLRTFLCTHTCISLWNESKNGVVSRTSIYATLA